MLLAFALRKLNIYRKPCYIPVFSRNFQGFSLRFIGGILANMPFLWFKAVLRGSRGYFIDITIVAVPLKYHAVV